MSNPNWREKAKNVEPTLICPTCNKEPGFGQLFFVGVDGMVQECRACRAAKMYAPEPLHPLLEVFTRRHSAKYRWLNLKWYFSNLWSAIKGGFNE